MGLHYVESTPSFLEFSPFPPGRGVFFSESIVLLLSGMLFSAGHNPYFFALTGFPLDPEFLRTFSLRHRILLPYPTLIDRSETATVLIMLSLSTPLFRVFRNSVWDFLS